jgi:hypothetical protein
MTRILLQTTIPGIEDDWHIGRFSLVAEHLRALTDSDGNALYDVTARDREDNGPEPDPLLSKLDESDFDQIWLFAVDIGDGLTPEDCAGITRFRKRGGGIMSTRDHNDLGSSLCTLGGVGAAHYFHSKQPDPDETRHVRDDNVAMNIDWPNYHSGANGNFQTISAVDHDLLRRPDGSLIEYFPAHPHEGGVGAPAEYASVVATSTSKVSRRPFNLVVAFENATDKHGNLCGRAIAESSFHHFADYNWNPDMGCPSFLEEPPGDEYRTQPERLDDIKQYVANAAAWLSQYRER